MKKFLSALLLLSLLAGVLCACDPSYNPALAELCEKYNDEFKAYPNLYTPKKDPSALENYDTLYSSAQAAADGGKLSLKHYLIPEKITSNKVSYLTAYLTKEDFENEKQFFYACLYQQILLDSFGTSTEEFLEKTGSMTEQERAAYTEERLQMLKYVATQSGELFDSISYSFEKALCNEPDTFCCYDLLLRTEFAHCYQYRFLGKKRERASRLGVFQAMLRRIHRRRRCQNSLRQAGLRTGKKELRRITRPIIPKNKKGVSNGCLRRLFL